MKYDKFKEYIDRLSEKKRRERLEQALESPKRALGKRDSKASYDAMRKQTLEHTLPQRLSSTGYVYTWDASYTWPASVSGASGLKRELTVLAKRQKRAFEKAHSKEPGYREEEQFAHGVKPGEEDDR